MRERRPANDVFAGVRGSIYEVRVSRAPELREVSMAAALLDSHPDGRGYRWA